MFRWGYVTMEKYSIALNIKIDVSQKSLQSKTSQPCLHTSTKTHLWTNESARSISVIL